MKKTILIFSTVLILLGLAGFAWAQCPEDPNDNGECDTLYVEGYPPDLQVGPQGSHFVRFPIYVTHDVPDPAPDSIAGFYIPLCYSHTNTSKYCSLSAWWNNTDLYPFPTIDRSIFRHLDGETNWMMDLSEQLMAREWDTRILELDGTSHFWMALVPTGAPDQRFGPGSRVLLATMTFKLEDTTTITIDSCCWSPYNVRLGFFRADAVLYIPRHFLPVTQSIVVPGNNCTLPIEVNLPADLSYSDLGQTTCGRGDDYDSTCLGYFDGGEDIIYELTVTSPVEVDIMLDPKGTTWTGIALDDDCPLNPYTCLYESSNMDSSPHGFSDVHLEPGTYYITIDTWPPPTCIPDFDLTITSPYICGDCTQDGIIDLGDVLFLISYLYKGGLAPDPLAVADVNCDGTVELGDVLYMISYLYKGGSAPCDPDGNGIPDC